MSTTAGIAAQPTISKQDPLAVPVNNPFDTVFDDEGDNYEWWDENDAASPAPKKAVKVSGTTAKSLNRNVTKKGEKRYSVQKPIRNNTRGRQRKQNAQAGIKLVTDFSARQKEPPAKSQSLKSVPQGCFVDLAALQALNGEPTQSGGFWKSIKTKGGLGSASKPSAETLSPDISTDRSSTLVPSPIDQRSALSPNDRPIMIGLSIPSRDVSMHSLSPQTASSDTTNLVQGYEIPTPIIHTPQTPTIIITPAAQEGSAWSSYDEGSTYRGQVQSATSSFYSQGTAAQVDLTKNTPPVPKVPISVLKTEQQRLASQKSCFSPDSDDGDSWEDESVRSRVVSTCTIFEEDVSPVLAMTARGVSVFDGSKAGKRASVSTVATRRHSKGWWNFITTPFLTRSNTFANREAQDQQPPSLPSLATAVAKAQEAGRDGKIWEKQFSPMTPATSTTIQSDSWWNVDAKDSKPAAKSPIRPETIHRAQPSTGTIPFFLSEGVFSETPAHINDGVAARGTLLVESPSPSSHSETTTLPPTPEINPRSLESNNPFAHQRMETINNYSNVSISTRRDAVQPTQIVIQQAPQPVFISVQHAQASPLEPTPPPPYSPSATRGPRYRAIFPPGHGLNVQQPLSPGPITPGMQNAMASPGAIQMSDVPLTPPPARGPINLNSSYPELPPRQNSAHITADHLRTKSDKAKKLEVKRRRHEKEDAIAHRAGGWWRGRGCIPKRGCYSRSGAEGRKRRRCYLGLIIAFLSIIILAIVLATTLHRKPSSDIGPSQWLNLTGFPPIFTGLSTIAAPANTVTNTGCVFPATEWSCALPKEQQASVAPNSPNQPNFVINIQWDNSSSANATFANVTGNPNLPIRSIGGNAVSAGQFVKHMLLRAKRAITFVPSPKPPSFADDFFLGNTTDGIVSDNKAGEPTPFYISFLVPTTSNITKRTIFQRQSTNTDNSTNSDNSTTPDTTTPDSPTSSDNSTNLFPNISSIIPAPSLNPDGTAAPANLLPLPVQQPIRLYDRGLPTEHYGFYTYFDRSIFLKSIDGLNSSNLGDGEVPDDENGGATEAAANFRCTWTQTRFLVQMWTRMNTTSQLLNSTHTTTTPSTSFLQPGTFPYPATITVDRHGGDPSLKMLYCYSMNDRQGIDASSGLIMQEQRFFGGNLINPAAMLFLNQSDPSLGGFDGGTGGCKCQWENFQGLN